LRYSSLKRRRRISIWNTVVPSLVDMQRAFASAILAGNPSNIAKWVSGDGIYAAQRLQIHTNNVQWAFVSTLSRAFPVIRRLGGDDWFLQSVRQYHKCFPARCGDMQYLGDHYPEYLHSEMRTTAHEYFVDVARLEWAYQEVLIAAETPPLDITSLTYVAPGEYECIRFTLRTQARLVRSSYPVLAIWQANQPDRAADRSRVSLDDGSSHVLVIRRERAVELHELPAATFDFLSHFERGAALGEAASANSERHPLFNLSAALRQLVALEILGNIHISVAAHDADRLRSTRRRGGQSPCK
jgi:hypothetical protein